VRWSFGAASGSVGGQRLRHTRSGISRKTGTGVYRNTSTGLTVITDAPLPVQRYFGMFGVAGALLYCSFGIKVMTTTGTAVSRYKKIEV
jgi:hypothetical protein